MSPGQIEVKQGNFVEFISRVKGYLRETYKLQNINPISLTPKFTLGRGLSVSKNIYHVAAFIISFNLICNMTMF